MNDTQRYLTVEQLIQIIPLKKSRVYYLVHIGEIPCIHLGRTLLFDFEEIHQWLESMKGKPCHRSI
jgi:excisionase family DNA binding protein